MLPLRSGPRRPFTSRFLRAAFALRAGFQPARSPSLPIVTLRAFHAKRRLALLWIRLPPIDFCNCKLSLPRRGHNHEHPILADRLEFRAWQNFSELALASVAVLPATGFPLRRSFAKAASRDSPSDDAPRGAASTPRDTSPKVTARPRRRLRATPKPNHRLRRWLLDGNAELHGSRSLERRTSRSRALLPQGTWVKVPLLCSLDSSSTPETIRFVADSSRVRLDSSHVLSCRPRPSFHRRPAKDNAFPEAGMLSTVWNLAGMRITPHTGRPTPP